MIRHLTSVLLLLAATKAFAIQEIVPANVNESHMIAELVVGADVQADQYGYDVTIIDPSDVGMNVAELTDEQLFAANGAIDHYGVSGRLHHRSASGACGGGRRCAASSGGVASWYGPGFNGHRTANGEVFHDGAMTAASKSYCFNSLVRVTYHARSVIVRINDAGPYVGGRVIDLSRAAASSLGLSTGPVAINLVRCGG